MIFIAEFKRELQSGYPVTDLTCGIDSPILYGPCESTTEALARLNQIGAKPRSFLTILESVDRVQEYDGYVIAHTCEFNHEAVPAGRLFGIIELDTKPLLELVSAS